VVEVGVEVRIGGGGTICTQQKKREKFSLRKKKTNSGSRMDILECLRRR